MWIRIELHNHTIESDGTMTPTELSEFMAAQEIPCFSLTDHNTISGLSQLPAACGDQIRYIFGYELTSYYGHMLSQTMSSYIPWDDIDSNNADLLFHRVHEAGGLAGPAHPFSVPSPFSNGMRWDMNIHDPGLIDFIEIINNAHPMIPDNYQAIQWWIHLSCSGFPIAPVSGLDLHGPMDLSGVFTTFIETEDNFSRFQNASQLLAQAIRRCRTCVTRGPVLHWTLSGETLTLSLLPGLTPVPIQEPETEASFFCIIKTEKDSLVIPIGNKDCHVSLPYTIRSSKGAVLLLFPAESFHSEQLDFSYLTAVSGPIFF